MMTKYKIFLVVGVLATVYLLGRCQRPLRSGGTSTNGPSRGVAAVLPSIDKERISFNEKTHTLTIQTQTKTIKEYANNPDIQIRKDNTIQINRHHAGFENSLFLGAGYSDTGRILLGDNFFHFSRFDIMGAVGWTPDSRYSAFKVYTGVSYLAYSSTAVGLGVDPVSLVTGKPLLIGFVLVRL
jgi:hypothetical protein